MVQADIAVVIGRLLMVTMLLSMVAVCVAGGASGGRGGARWPAPLEPHPPGAKIEKDFHATVDIGDDMWRARGALTRQNIESFMTRLAQLGIKRVYWIAHAEDFLSPASLADDVAHVGMLKTAAEAAHRANMSIYAIFKPFETGVTTHFLPHGVRAPRGTPTIQRISGRCIVAPFVVEHPHCRIKRRPSPPWRDSAVAAIKLVKSDASRTRLCDRHLSVWISQTNGQFTRYAGGFGFHDGIEQRAGRDVRVLTLSGLNVEPKHRYIMVRCGLRDGRGDFRNAESRMMEICDSSGQPIPATWDEGVCTRSDLERRLIMQSGMRRGRFALDLPYELPDDYGRSIETSAFSFNTGSTPKVRTLDGNKTPADGQVALAKGKDVYVAGGLHPIYSEVRQYWLDQIRTFIAAGVDGIDIRVTNHSTWTCEGEEYGFNEPVVEEFKRRYGTDILAEPFDRERWKQLQGEYYTTFLRDARALTKKHRVAMQLHVNGLMGVTIRWWERNNVPANFAWEWEKWIRDDVCDSIALKYIPWEFGAERGKGVELGQRVARLARQYGKSVFSHARLPWWVLVRTPGQKELTQSDLDLILAKIRWGWRSRMIDGVIIYETMAFVQMDPVTGSAHVSPAAAAILDAVRNGTAGQLQAGRLKNYDEAR